MNAVLWWVRRDLRLADNPALTQALSLGEHLVPAFIWGPEEEEPWPAGAASRWWLHHSLAAFGRTLRERGSRLVLRRGPALETLRDLCAETGARAVRWSRCYDPTTIARDKAVKEGLSAAGIDGRSVAGSLFCEPWDLEKASGGPYRVFTPFWRSLRARIDPAREVRAAPGALGAPRRWPKSVPLEALELLPRIDWAGGLRESWEPGEDGATAALERFRLEAVKAYGSERDRPDRAGTSRLSPHLHFGEISPARVAAVLSGAEAEGEPYLRQLGWREFAVHLLYHYPETTKAPLMESFARFPWRSAPAQMRAWERGSTGYPLVDAGMRELWHTGWMHNRVRMVVASFLVKHLLIRWQGGAEWFWDTLVDADLANNTLGWQWCAGCGADAAPYFRIFNPVSQGQRYDPDGAYVRRWIPELRRVDARWIHRPWEAPPLALAESGLRLGVDYPRPIVEHKAARERALAAYAKIRSR